MGAVTILDPRAEVGVAITPYARAIDTSRRGLRIALFSNTFFDATNLLKALGECLPGHLNAPLINLYERPNPSVAAPLEQIEEIARANDVAVTALGHCGSCTSSATRNAVNLARAGLPVAALISSKFITASGFVARSVGMPDVPRVELPHPVSGTGAVRIAEIAAGAAAQLVASWRGAYVRAA